MRTIDGLLDLAGLPAAALPESARLTARFSLFDWMACGLAGAGEPLARILRDMVQAEGGAGQASVIGGGRAPARAAALVNGATSHALDYDDTHFGHVGHLSVGIYPAALAAGELAGARLGEVADAFAIGAEAAVRLGMTLGAVHYDRGFHQTATAGAFGAALAAARLLGLTRTETRAALGLCATRASGLKSQFGTMGKPYNAGIAAANGIEAALLARAGFTSAEDGLEGPQGFVPTHSDAPVTSGIWDDPPPGRFLFEEVKYKLHACCHGTHAMIEGLAGLVAAESIAAGDVVRIRLETAPRWLKVCDIRTPATGLEVKFSYAWLAAMVLAGIPTASDRVYTDALASDPGLGGLARRVEVAGAGGLGDMQARGEIHLADGRVLGFAHDLGQPLPAEALERGLRDKARALAGGRAETLWAAAFGPGTLAAADLGALLGAG